MGVKLCRAFVLLMVAIGTIRFMRLVWLQCEHHRFGQFVAVLSQLESAAGNVAVPDTGI